MLLSPKLLQFKKGNISYNWTPKMLEIPQIIKFSEGQTLTV